MQRSTFLLELLRLLKAVIDLLVVWITDNAQVIAAAVSCAVSTNNLLKGIRKKRGKNEDETGLH